MAAEWNFWDTYNALKLKIKEGKKNKSDKKNPISLSLVPNRQAALLVLRLCLCAAAAFMPGVTERGTCIHYLKGENRVSS